MEPRFGHDFSQVRVHTDARAAESAKAVNALAYTFGQDVVFESDQFAPAIGTGRRLLAHELARTLQQVRSELPTLAGSTRVSEPGDTHEHEAEAIADDVVSGNGIRPIGEVIHPFEPAIQRDAVPTPPGELEGGSPAPARRACAINPDCPDTFCSPFPTQAEAIASRDQNIDSIVSTINSINSGSGGLFREYLLGGSASRRDLSNSFANDFTRSATVLGITEFLSASLEAELRAHPPSFSAGENRVTVQIASVIPDAIREIGDPTAVHQMNFTDYSEVPGLIAGGIGMNQAACRVGKNPSAFDDERLADGTADVFRNPDGSLLVDPSINYTVNDTIDFCPGNCGGFFAQHLGNTILMSRYEATDIAGDLPFTVRFPAPSLVGAYGSELG